MKKIPAAIVAATHLCTLTAPSPAVCSPSTLWVRLAGSYQRPSQGPSKNEGAGALRSDCLLKSIYAHPFYGGSIDQFLPGQVNKIYDFLDAQGAVHFYFCHPTGARHFCLRSSALLNGSGRSYPSLQSLLRCAWTL